MAVVHGSGSDDDKGFGEQVRQVREKLVQLENEIEWYKSRNAALEKLRVEREKVHMSICLSVSLFILHGVRTSCPGMLV